jgi:hypothetical protein
MPKSKNRSSLPDESKESCGLLKTSRRIDAGCPHLSVKAASATGRFLN